MSPPEELALEQRTWAASRARASSRRRERQWASGSRCVARARPASRSVHARGTWAEAPARDGGCLPSLCTLVKC